MEAAIPNHPKSLYSEDEILPSTTTDMNEKDDDAKDTKEWTTIFITPASAEEQLSKIETSTCFILSSLDAGNLVGDSAARMPFSTQNSSKTSSAADAPPLRASTEQRESPYESLASGASAAAAASPSWRQTVQFKGPRVIHNTAPCLVRCRGDGQTSPALSTSFGRRPDPSLSSLSRISGHSRCNSLMTVVPGERGEEEGGGKANGGVVPDTHLHPVLHEVVLFLHPVEIFAEAPISFVGIAFSGNVTVRGKGSVQFVNCTFSKRSFADQCRSFTANCWQSPRVSTKDGPGGPSSPSTTLPSTAAALGGGGGGDAAKSEEAARDGQWISTNVSSDFASPSGGAGEAMQAVSFTDALGAEGDDAGFDGWMSKAGSFSPHRFGMGFAVPSTMAQAQSLRQSLEAAAKSMKAGADRSRAKAPGAYASMAGCSYDLATSSAIDICDEVECGITQCDIFGGSGGGALTCREKCRVSISDSSFSGPTITWAAAEVCDEAVLDMSYVNVQQVMGCGLLVRDSACAKVDFSLIECCGVGGVIATAKAAVELHNTGIEASSSGVCLALSGAAKADVSDCTLTTDFPMASRVSVVALYEALKVFNGSMTAGAEEAIPAAVAKAALCADFSTLFGLWRVYSRVEEFPFMTSSQSIVLVDSAVASITESELNCITGASLKAEVDGGRNATESNPTAGPSAVSLTPPLYRRGSSHSSPVPPESTFGSEAAAAETPLRFPPLAAALRHLISGLLNSSVLARGVLSDFIADQRNQWRLMEAAATACESSNGRVGMTSVGALASSPLTKGESVSRRSSRWGDGSADLFLTFEPPPEEDDEENAASADRASEWPRVLRCGSSNESSPLVQKERAAAVASSLQASLVKIGCADALMLPQGGVYHIVLRDRASLALSTSFISLPIPLPGWWMDGLAASVDGKLSHPAPPFVAVVLDYSSLGGRGSGAGGLPKPPPTALSCCGLHTVSNVIRYECSPIAPPVSSTTMSAAKAQEVLDGAGGKEETMSFFNTAAWGLITIAPPPAQGDSTVDGIIAQQEEHWGRLELISPSGHSHSTQGNVNNSRTTSLNCEEPSSPFTTTSVAATAVTDDAKSRSSPLTGAQSPLVCHLGNIFLNMADQTELLIITRHEHVLTQYPTFAAALGLPLGEYEGAAEQLQSSPKLVVMGGTTLATGSGLVAPFEAKMEGNRETALPTDAERGKGDSDASTGEADGESARLGMTAMQRRMLLMDVDAPPLASTAELHMRVVKYNSTNNGSALEDINPLSADHGPAAGGEKTGDDQSEPEGETRTVAVDGKSFATATDGIRAESCQASDGKVTRPAIVQQKGPLTRARSGPLNEGNGPLSSLSDEPSALPPPPQLLQQLYGSGSCDVEKGPTLLVTEISNTRNCTPSSSVGTHDSTMVMAASLLQDPQQLSADISSTGQERSSPSSAVVCQQADLPALEAAKTAPLPPTTSDQPTPCHSSFLSTCSSEQQTDVTGCSSEALIVQEPRLPGAFAAEDQVVDGGARSPDRGAAAVSPKRIDKGGSGQKEEIQNLPSIYSYFETVQTQLHQLQRVVTEQQAQIWKVLDLQAQQIVTNTGQSQSASALETSVMADSHILTVSSAAQHSLKSSQHSGKTTVETTQPSSKPGESTTASSLSSSTSSEVMASSRTPSSLSTTLTDSTQKAAPVPSPTVSDPEYSSTWPSSIRSTPLASPKDHDSHLLGSIDANTITANATPSPEQPWAVTGVAGQSHCEPPSNGSKFSRPGPPSPPPLGGKLTTQQIAMRSPLSGKSSCEAKASPLDLQRPRPPRTAMEALITSAQRSFKPASAIATPVLSNDRPAVDEGEDARWQREVLRRLTELSNQDGGQWWRQRLPPSSSMRHGALGRGAERLGAEGSSGTRAAGVEWDAPRQGRGVASGPPKTESRAVYALNPRVAQYYSKGGKTNNVSHPWHLHDWRPSSCSPQLSNTLSSYVPVTSASTTSDVAVGGQPTPGLASTHPYSSSTTALHAPPPPRGQLPLETRAAALTEGGTSSTGSEGAAAVSSSSSLLRFHGRHTGSSQAAGRGRSAQPRADYRRSSSTPLSASWRPQLQHSTSQTPSAGRVYYVSGHPRGGTGSPSPARLYDEYQSDEDARAAWEAFILQSVTAHRKQGRLTMQEQRQLVHRLYTEPLLQRARQELSGSTHHQGLLHRLQDSNGSAPLAAPTQQLLGRRGSHSKDSHMAPHQSHSQLPSSMTDSSSSLRSQVGFDRERERDTNAEKGKEKEIAAAPPSEPSHAHFVRTREACDGVKYERPTESSASGDLSFEEAAIAAPHPNSGAGCGRRSTDNLGDDQPPHAALHPPSQSDAPPSLPSEDAAAIQGSSSSLGITVDSIPDQPPSLKKGQQLRFVSRRQERDAAEVRGRVTP